MIHDIVKRLACMPPQSKLIIFGGGYSGQRIASVGRLLGAKVLCSRRKKDSTGADFVFNSDNELSNEILEGATHVLSCIPPLMNGKDPVLNKVKSKLLNSKTIEWVGYLSTTGVYGNTKGAWVNEATSPNPQQERSVRRFSCEQEWLETKLPIQILRLPGIYGPGRSAFESLLNGTLKMIDKPDQVFSRIHVDDIAGAVFFLINLYSQGNNPSVVNIADNLPTSNLEVNTFAAKLAKQSLPSTLPFEIAKKTMSPMALSFWQENRKIDNKLLCKKLGYSLLYPDFKSGLKNCYSKLKVNN
ncbi:SDR family oxidoreductase [Prochlorococcus marinus]|uniref:NAD(P)-dependent oxidoreductase n=1 Tax=Prochlorococcus marinus XMU1408 TaxID=2213228 RepID=A0A318R256_PROMR|nr:SDR family oxidoreductase [Prochlorococcus marinus]MBW3042590.1 NAD(P)-dependent oxidoreductase [Prochlorococcus marinus str. XMU1408]PYE03635.1 NAD(P)-dependent oxidoreductase [Prochlorococcus marinus XMU1408]